MKIAVIIPCYNEEGSISQTIREYKRALPASRVFVCDNNSTDKTNIIAKNLGAKVIEEKRKGKGWAVKRLFNSVDADIYVLVDGDFTYSAASVIQHIKTLISSNSDMAIGNRVADKNYKIPFRPGHLTGNRVLTLIFTKLFKLEISDCLSGYRIMSRRFVKTFVSNSQGFEIETDLNVHAAELDCKILNVDVNYRNRLSNSHSKLRTVQDGIRILKRNVLLFHDARPLLSFSILSIPWFLVSIALFGFVLVRYIKSGLVLNFPSLIASTAAFLVGSNLLVGGLVAQRTSKMRRDLIRLFFHGY